MTTELAHTNGHHDIAGFESALLQGDLSKLSPDQRTTYYLKVCESVGLNPFTKPFDYLSLSGKTVLYAKRDATDQLRKIHGVSLRITDRQTTEGVYVVTASATDKAGRIDESTGAVTVAGLKGDALANALMKAETKAKRRVTLSICGLGMLDETETETETIPGAIPVNMEAVNTLPKTNGQHKTETKPTPKPTTVGDKPTVETLTAKWIGHDFKGDGKAFGAWIARTVAILPEVATVPDDLKDLTEWVRDAAGMGDLQEWHDMSGEQILTGKAGVVEWLNLLQPKG